MSVAIGFDGRVAIVTGAASHSFYSATAGRFARVWMSDDNKPPIPEDIEQSLAEIDDIDSFVTPQSAFEAFIPIVAARKTELGS